MPRQTQGLAELPTYENLIDPITAKEWNIHHVPVDKILDYSFLDKVAYNLKTLFVTLPKTVYKGLRGDADFSFSDFMLISQIPYYLGGLVLTMSFMAGRNKPTAIRQGVGVGLYYLGAMAASKAVNFIYKKRYGVDLDLMYRRADGRVEKVFASVDFPRFDLLSQKQLRTMQDKMGIPSTVADRDQACREQLFRIISSARSMKLILGNVLAAAGAGYFARTDAWARLLDGHGTLKTIWTASRGNILERVSKTGLWAKSIIGPAVQEKVMGTPGEVAPWLRKLTLAGIGATILLCLAESMNVLKLKRYESSPITLIPRGENWMNQDSLFNRFQLSQEEGRRR